MNGNTLQYEYGHSLYIRITNFLTQIYKRLVCDPCAQKHSFILEHRGATQSLGEQTVIYQHHETPDVSYWYLQKREVFYLQPHLLNLDHNT